MTLKHEHLHQQPCHHFVVRTLCDDANDHPGYKDIKIRHPDLKGLDILQKVFGLSDDKLKSHFYNAEVRKNHARVGKRHFKMGVGNDVVDIVMRFDDDFVYLKRFKITEREEVSDDKFELTIRRWKALKLKRIQNTEDEGVTD